jgi:glycosyltransferase involved in cell wall biosynthesis
VRLAILASHPIQYHAPLFREVARRLDCHVYYAHKATPHQQAASGFGTAFDWDVDLTAGFAHSFLANVARYPDANRFGGCDTPEILSRLKEGRFDALLVLGWNLKCFLQGLFAAKRIGLPVMVRGDSHLTTPRPSIKRVGKAVVYPPFLRLFDAALYVGQRSRAYYAHYGYPASRLFFSPHCVDAEWFAARATRSARQALRARLGIGDETKILLFAGKLVPFKRPLDLIAAAAWLRSKGHQSEVMVAGDGELRAQMTSAALASEVPIHVLGFCNQTEMPAAYAAADCLILPSDGRETWGLVANEALACGLPVIISDACGCAPDLAGDRQAGLTFAMADVHDLASAIATLITAPPSSESIAATSGRFTLRAAADGIARAAENCCKA